MNYPEQTLDPQDFISAGQFTFTSFPYVIFSSHTEMVFKYAIIGLSDVTVEIHVPCTIILPQ